MGKQVDRFTAELSPSLFSDLAALFSVPSANIDSQRPPVNWPAILTFHATACLMPVWETLGVDPLEVRLVAEEFLCEQPPQPGQLLTGIIRIEELSEWVENDGTIEEQVDMVVAFANAAGESVAEYRCGFRIPLTK